MSGGPVQRQLDAYNDGDVDAFVACYTQDVVVRHGDGRVLMTGRDEMREKYGELFAQHSDLNVEVVHRLVVGPWVVDEELVSMGGRQRRALVAYHVAGEAIQSVVMMAAEG